MSRHDFAPPALSAVPITAWPSLLSLDAVFVALAWQKLLLTVFCYRSASGAEMCALAAAVWLIYVADRLLDASRLQLSQPHTLRHRFYLHYARPFLLLWVLVLTCATIAVAQCLPSELLRGGLLLASGVLVYGAQLHLGSRVPSERVPAPVLVATKLSFPKEICVGTLFALGVALSTGAQLAANGAVAATAPATASAWISTGLSSPWGKLLATTCALSLLFSCNCMLVARFEYQLDQAQAFPSIATQTDHWPATIAIGSLPVLLLLFELPSVILVGIMASGLGLALSLAIPSSHENLSQLPYAATAFDIRTVWVDAALWTPPVVLGLF